MPSCGLVRARQYNHSGRYVEERRSVEDSTYDHSCMYGQVLDGLCSVIQQVKVISSTDRDLTKVEVRSSAGWSVQDNRTIAAGKVKYRLICTG